MVHRPGGALIEAACWAPIRRKFFDVHAKTGSAVALEALEWIGTIYEVDRSVRGKPPDERRRQRQARSRPLAAALKAWAETILPQLSGDSDLAKAFRYMLARWTALTRVFDEWTHRARKQPGRAGAPRRGGRAQELPLRRLGPRRRPSRRPLHPDRAAKLNGIDPEAYLRAVLTRIADQPAKRLTDLLPWNWTPLTPLPQAA